MWEEGGTSAAAAPEREGGSAERDGVKFSMQALW